MRKVHKELTYDDFPAQDIHSGLELYLQQINQFPRLNNKEKDRFLEAIRRGRMAEASDKEKEEGKAAWNRMILCHLYMVVNIASNMQVKNVNLEDLIQEGNIELIKSLASYEESYCLTFIQFAYVRIERAIWNAIVQNSSVIRIPTRTVEMVSNVRKTITQFYQENKRRPTYKELVELTGYSLNLIKLCEKAQVETFSLDAMLCDNQVSNTIQYDPLQIPVEETIENTLDMENFCRKLTCYMKDLTEKQKYVLQELYYGHKDYSAVQEQLGISRQRVLQLRRRALEILKFRFTHPRVTYKPAPSTSQSAPSFFNRYHGDNRYTKAFLLE